LLYPLFFLYFVFKIDYITVGHDKECISFLVKDVAPGKQATQSSNYISQYVANNALNDIWDISSCTHTNTEDNPWWKVNLDAVYTIKKVVLVNRQNALGNCLLSLLIFTH